MGDSGILDKVQSHFTVVGQMWARVHFIFRILVLWAGATIVWREERSQMVCEPNTPGCEDLCYDWKFPISHLWFWVMQIIFASAPSLLYLGYVVEAIRQKNKLKQEQKHPNSSKVVIEGNLLIIYLTQLLVKIVIEMAFIIGQNFLFGFSMIPKFLCSVPPCNQDIECFMFRSTEKTTFIILMLVLSCVSLALTVVDVFYLLFKRGFLRRYNRADPTWKETDV